MPRIDKGYAQRIICYSLLVDTLTVDVKSRIDVSRANIPWVDFPWVDIPKGRRSVGRHSVGRRSVGRPTVQVGQTRLTMRLHLGINILCRRAEGERAGLYKMQVAELGTRQFFSFATTTRRQRDNATR